jgi:hypothetical protein
MAGKLNDPAGDKEKAEGDRETVDQALRNAEEAERRRQPGITNKPVEEEEEQQRELPPRGHAKREDEGTRSA